MGRPHEPGEGWLSDAESELGADRQRRTLRCTEHICGAHRGPDPCAKRRRPRCPERRGALPELIEGTAVRLVSYFGPDDAGSGIVVDDRVIPLVEYAGFDVDPDALDDLRRRAAALTGAEGIPIEELELVTPVIAPGKIVCVGLNYREHASEGGRPLPSRPILFSKFANALVADGQPIVRPEGTHALDLEVELGVVIGTTARRVSLAEALDHVAGYVVVNDVSARDWQGVPAALGEGEVGDGQWLRAKGSDTFLPMGSVFVTADEVPDPQALRIRSWRIPGTGPDAGAEVLMQDANTSDMIWGVADLIEYISRSITLEPGDVIATGTPSGVGVFRDPPVFLEPGDRVRCEIEGIGSVENPVIDWLEDIDDAGEIEGVGDFELDDLIGRP
jgi:2-keto-4-pentenoate hydratase/2-oxohepta-3-ene-1,7-dioic acid hydratase in catechol pathway